MANFANDRRYVRRDVRIDCEVVRTRDFRRIGSRTLDLSTKGMLLLGELGARIGERVQVFFQIPDSTEYVFVEGIVKRHVRGLRRTDKGRGFGIQFGELEPRVHDLLFEKLSRFPLRRPARRQRLAPAPEAQLGVAA
jgi:hypothetical protein